MAEQSTKRENATSNQPSKKLKLETQGDIFRPKVLIVGAGPAGLAAANFLRKDGRMECELLEARNRLGGRIPTKSVSGFPVDLGASYVHGAHKLNPLFNLLEARNVKMDKTGGGYSAAWGAECAWKSSSDKPIPPSALNRCFKVLSEARYCLTDLSAKIADTGKADLSIEAALAQMADLILPSRRLSPVEQEIWESLKVLAWAYCAPLNDLSLKAYTVFDLETEENLSKVDTLDEEPIPTDIEFGDAIVVQGYQQLIDILAEEVPEESIHLDSIVKQIQWEEEVKKGELPRVEVTLLDGTKYNGNFVVFTGSIGVLKGLHETSRITFNPPLPQWKLEALDKMAMGQENKIVMRFATDLFPGIPYLQCPDPRFRFVNLSYFGKKGIIVGHSGPPFSPWSIPDDQLLQEILGVLTKMYEKPLPRLQQHIITKWHEDPFALGSYSYLRVGCTLSDIRKVRRNCGNLYFAGEATSVNNAQCVHGAYETGQAAVEEILSHCFDVGLICCQASWDGSNVVQCSTCDGWAHAQCPRGYPPISSIFTTTDAEWICTSCQAKQQEVK